MPRKTKLPISSNNNKTTDNYVSSEDKLISQLCSKEEYFGAIEDTQNLFSNRKSVAQLMSLDDFAATWSYSAEKKEHDEYLEVVIDKKTVFADYGDRIFCSMGILSSKIADIMLSAVKERGWRAVSISSESSDCFAMRVYLACARAGIKTAGYHPLLKLKDLAKLMAELCSGDISFSAALPKDRTKVRIDDIEQQLKKAFGKLSVCEKDEINTEKENFDNKQISIWADQYKGFLQKAERSGQSSLNPHQRKIMKNADKYGYGTGIVSKRRLDLKDYDNIVRLEFENQRNIIRDRNNLLGLCLEKAALIMKIKVIDNIPDTPEYVSADDIKSLANELMVGEKRKALLSDHKKQWNHLAARISSQEEWKNFETKMLEIEQQVLNGAFDTEEPSSASLKSRISFAISDILISNDIIKSRIDNGDYKGFGDSPVKKDRSEMLRQKKAGEGGDYQMAIALRKRIYNEAVARDLEDD